MNTTEKRRKQDEMLDLEEKHDHEEDMWPEGDNVREESAYGSTKNDRVEQEHPRHRDTVNRT